MPEPGGAAVSDRTIYDIAAMATVYDGAPDYPLIVAILLDSALGDARGVLLLDREELGALLAMLTQVHADMGEHLGEQLEAQRDLEPEPYTREPRWGTTASGAPLGVGSLLAEEDDDT